MFQKCRAKSQYPGLRSSVRPDQKLPRLKDQYAMIAMRKGMYRMPNVVNKMEEREIFFSRSILCPQMVKLLDKTRSEYFRWFDSGDVHDVRMALNIIDVVKATPNKKHWIPTKEHKIWAEALKIEPLPDNAVLRLSQTMVDQAPPAKWKNSSAVIKVTLRLSGMSVQPQNKKASVASAAHVGTRLKTVSYHKH